MQAALVQSINLFQPEGGGWKGSFKPATIGWALLTIVLGAALLSTYAWLRERSFERSVAAVVHADQARTEQLARSSAALQSDGRLGQLQAHVAALEQRNDRLRLIIQRLGNSVGDPVGNAARGSKAPYSTIVAEVANAGFGGVWVSHIDISGDNARLTLRGTAVRPELLPEYLQSLGHQAALRGRAIGSFVVESATDAGSATAGAVNFTIAQQDEAEPLLAAVR
jgi:hypothetical protein